MGKSFVSTFPEHHSRGGQCDSSGEQVQWGKKLNFLKIGRVGWMGQKKGSFTPRSGVKTRSGGAWFVQSNVFRGWLFFLANVLLLAKKGSEGLPRRGFGGLIDSVDN